MDLPLHIRFLDARRYDSVSIFVALKELRSLIPSLNIRNLCLDSAHDNYPTYRLCGKWKIRPFIDLSENRGRPASIPGAITIDSDGTPICQARYRMVYWDSALGAAAVNGAALLPATKKSPVPANVLALRHLMDVVSIQNPAGISDFILLSPGVRQNIKKFITTAQVQNG